MAWIFLIIAAACEAAWTFSLKLMKFNDLKKLNVSTALNLSVSLPIILPFVGYIVFGLINIYFFSQAIKQLPMAMAFAVWTAISLIFIKLAEMLFLKQSISIPEAFFIIQIMTGIIGLKYYALAQ
ncbi:DMT family transporter [Mucilaginibacter corticis]|uniref:DMT family transporter n=1 Tax=Mucilaginibacter corticis TaxID=2597670 RepID=UPI001C913BAA|nr:SMR family transporter [Mucilaginibacter corticis]